MHSYDTLNPYSNKVNPRAVGYFGPNPVPIVGAGDCTFTLPSLERVSELPTAAAHKSIFDFGAANNPTQSGRVVTKMTIKNVMHIPTAGVNLISWSQLKRAKGLDLRLVEEHDGSLTVRNRGRELLMRFELRDGLYFLVQEPIPTPPSVGLPAGGEGE
jgi:hypothetical protein